MKKHITSAATNVCGRSSPGLTCEFPKRAVPHVHFRLDVFAMFLTRERAIEVTPRCRGPGGVIELNPYHFMFVAITVNRTLQIFKRTSDNIAYCTVTSFYVIAGSSGTSYPLY